MGKLVSLKNKFKNFFSNSIPSEPDSNCKYLDIIELSYLYSIFNLYKTVENVPGHIVELGVGAGRNSILL